MERYFKIGEVAKLYGIGTDTIRYYEQLGLITPVRGENGYRYYRISDIWRLNVIRDLRSLGFGMPRIARYLSSRSVGSTIALLREEEAEIDRKICHLRRLQASVKRRMQAVEATRTKVVGVVEQQHFARRPCHNMARPFTTDAEMDVLIKRLLNRYPEKLYIIGNTQLGARMDAAAIQRGEYHHYSGVFIIDEADKRADSAIEAGRFLTLRYRGSSRNTETAIPALCAHAAAHGLRLAGEWLELVLIDIHEAEDETEHITELQARVVD